MDSESHFVKISFDKIGQIKENAIPQKRKMTSKSQNGSPLFEVKLFLTNTNPFPKLHYISLILVARHKLAFPIG